MRSARRVRWFPAFFLAVSAMSLMGCAVSGGSASGYPFLVKDLSPLTLDEPTSQVLSRHDAVNPRDGSLYKTFSIDLPARSVISIRAQADDFTPIIALFAPEGTPLGASEAPVYGGDGQARLIRSVASGGRHLIVVSGSQFGDMGTFSVRVEEIDDNAGELNFPGTTQGILYRTDRRHPYSGSAMHVYPFDLDDPMVLEVSLESHAFDTYLTVVDRATNNAVAENDDWGGSTNSRVVAELPAGGYEIWVAGYGHMASGEYVLNVAEGQIMRSERFAIGEPYHGYLGSGNRASIPRTGRRGDALEFEVTRTSTFEAYMSSMDVDSYLYLLDAN